MTLYIENFQNKIINYTTEQLNLFTHEYMNLIHIYIYKCI